MLWIWPTRLLPPVSLGQHAVSRVFVHLPTSLCVLGHVLQFLQTTSVVGEHALNSSWPLAQEPHAEHLASSVGVHFNAVNEFFGQVLHASHCRSVKSVPGSLSNVFPAAHCRIALQWLFLEASVHCWYANESSGQALQAVHSESDVVVQSLVLTSVFPHTVHSEHAAGNPPGENVFVGHFPQTIDLGFEPPVQACCMNSPG